MSVGLLTEQPLWSLNGKCALLKTKTKCVQLLLCFKIWALYLCISFALKLAKYSGCCYTYSQSRKSPFLNCCLLGWLFFIICIKVKSGNLTVCLFHWTILYLLPILCLSLPGHQQIIFCFAISVCICRTGKIINDNPYLTYKDVVKIN